VLLQRENVPFLQRENVPFSQIGEGDVGWGTMCWE
jgi:hypothetical protein